MTPYERVKLSRKRTAGAFPLPNVTDCIRYAITELAEMDDAWLRIERIGDKRNNARVHDPRAELGQALYMLLSAAVQHGIVPVQIDGIRHNTYECAYADALHKIARLLSALQLSRIDGAQLQSAFDDAYTALITSGAIFEMDDVIIMVDDTCAAFEAKHAAAQP